jgi:hypothetical protein
MLSWCRSLVLTQCYHIDHSVGDDRPDPRTPFKDGFTLFPVLAVPRNRHAHGMFHLDDFRGLT